MKGDWSMFNGRLGTSGVIFLYNKNTGAVYKYYQMRDENGFRYGFQRATILNDSSVEIPSAF